jgi:hypothetical protein
MSLHIKPRKPPENNAGKNIFVPKSSESNLHRVKEKVEK